MVLKLGIYHCMKSTQWSTNDRYPFVCPCQELFHADLHDPAPIFVAVSLYYCMSQTNHVAITLARGQYSVLVSFSVVSLVFLNNMYVLPKKQVKGIRVDTAQGLSQKFFKYNSEVFNSFIYTWIFTKLCEIFSTFLLNCTNYYITQYKCTFKYS